MRTVKFFAMIDGRAVMETQAYPLAEALEDEFMDISNNLSSRLMESDVMEPLDIE